MKNETSIQVVIPAAKGLRYWRESSIRGPNPVAPSGCLLVAYSESRTDKIRVWYLRPDGRDGLLDPPTFDRGKLVDPLSIRPRHQSARWKLKARVRGVVRREWQRWCDAQFGRWRPWQRSVIRFFRWLWRRNANPA